MLKMTYIKRLISFICMYTSISYRSITNALDFRRNWTKDISKKRKKYK